MTAQPTVFEVPTTDVGSCGRVDCERPVCAKGRCRRHYTAAWYASSKAQARAADPSACENCAAPITQNATGRRKVRCVACVARHKAKYMRKLRAAWSAERYEVEAQYQREYMLQKNYGIGVDERDARLAAQAGRCAICRTDEPNGHGWHVDHDHATGSVRGILCHGCNTGGGLYKEDPAVLRVAADYFESHARRTS